MTTGPESQTTTVGSVLQFRVDYDQTKEFPVDKVVHSDVVSVGGHLWSVSCYPGSTSEADKVDHISIFLNQTSKTSTSIKVIFEAFLMDRNGRPSTTMTERLFCDFPVQTNEGNIWGLVNFAKRNIVVNKYVQEGHITFVCSITVMDDSPIPVPPSDIGIHLGRLLDHKDGMDVSFVVDGETFGAHRAVLAARSPVFRAELFGSMAEATMSSITIQEIKSATFRAMIRFMYTDTLPVEDELEGDSAVQIFRDLLAAADRYALDRLKLLCAQKLWDKVSAVTVANTLACAEIYNCSELTNKCIDFLAVEKHFKEVVFTDGYALLLLKFPRIIAELKRRVRA